MSLRGRHAGARSIAPTVRFLVVSVGGTHLALYADRIQGLMTLEEAGSARELTIQGVVYPPVDLAGRLQCPLDPDGPDTRVILFSQANIRANIRVAVVHGLQELEQSQVIPLPRQFRGEEQQWYQGMILFKDTVAFILNPAWMLSGMELERQGGSSHVPYSRPVLLGGRT